MKYILIVPDGAADKPIPEFGQKTPLQKADTPNLDTLVQKGLLGRIRTVPESLPSGSDVACMSLLGYDPRRYYTGRASLEAASLGIELKKGEVAFRCNLVTVQDGKMQDYSAGHISSEEAKKLIEALQKELGNNQFHFYPGVQYRHIMIAPDHYKDVTCKPPHDIAGQEIKFYDPQGNGANDIKLLMANSTGVLEEQSVNRERQKKGELPATQIWLWGQGTRPTLPSFKEKYGLDGAVISAVDLVRGVGQIVGLKVIHVPGATGYFDTDYRAKAQYGLRTLRQKDFVFIHVESTDEAGHMGEAKLKVRAIEDFDQKLLGTLLQGLSRDDVRLLLLPDHMTSTAIRTHTHDPVPFVVFGSGIHPNGFSTFTEPEAAQSPVWISEGHSLMEKFLKGDF